MKRYILGIMSIFVFLFACGFDSEGQKVYDNADVLSEQEEASLQEKCIEAAQQSKADFVIVTVDSLDGKAAKAYAGDFYDNNGFGYEGKEGTGTLLLISMEDRDVWISTSGKCEELFTSSSDDIIEAITPYLSDGAYYDGLSVYIQKTAEYIENGGKSDGQKLLEFFIQIVAALAIAGIAIWIMYSGSMSKMTVNGYTYATGHKSDVLQHYDVFQRTTTVSRHIERNPGGSGNYTGSSGNSHGGSGGKF